MNKFINPMCPVCGQGGLRRVLLLDLKSKAVVLCSECEAVWEGDEAFPISNYEIFENYMEKHGAAANWKNVIER